MLDVDSLSIDIGGGQDQRRCRPHGGNDIALAGLVAAQLKHLVAGHLGIVGRIIAGGAAFIFVAVRLPVGFDRQMAAAAAGCPAEMACETDHIFVFMRPIFDRNAAAKDIFTRFRAGFGHKLRARRLEIEVGM